MLSSEHDRANININSWSLKLPWSLCVLTAIEKQARQGRKEVHNGGRKKTEDVDQSKWKAP